MFRKILLSTVLLYSSVAAMAQPVFIDSVENNNIGGPCRMGEGGEMYVYHIKGADNSRLKQAKLVMHVTSGGQQEPRAVSVDIEKNTNILCSAGSNMGAMFLTYNTDKKSSMLMFADFSGNNVKKIPIEGIAPEQAVWDNDFRIYPIMQEGFLLVLPNAKRNMYTVTAYNTELNEMWKERFDTKYNTLEVVDAKMVGENLFLIRKEQADAKQQKYVYSLQVMNIINHGTSNIQELKDKDNNYCYAGVMNEQEGFVQVAGLCYKDGKFVPGLPSGVAVYEYEISGNIANSIFADGKQLGNFLPDPVIAGMATNSMLNITGIVNDNMQNAYGLVCELMEKNTDAKQKEAKIVISDMMTMMITKEGELQKLTMADRPPRLAITLKGIPATSDISSTANWLQRNKLFNTRFTMRLADGYYVCVKSTDTTKNEVDARFIRIDEPGSENQFSMAIGRTPTSGNEMRPIGKLSIVAGTADNKMRRWMHADIYSTMGTQVLFYNQSDNKVILYYDGVMKRNDK